MADAIQQSSSLRDDDLSSRPIASSSSPRNPQLTTSSLEKLGGGHGNEQSPVSPMMSRRTSLDSDRLSTVSGLTAYFPNNPAAINPAPAYVAPLGASQVVSEHLTSQRDPSSDEDDEEKLDKDDVQFTDQALSTINAFLDQLLFGFLSTARSTSLLALRPAVLEVLKHRLARDAISSAEEELEALLAGGDDEEEEGQNKTSEDSRKWDLELVWKRTRLRVMVYMRYGDMEDEDEQRYVREGELFHGHERRFSQSSGLVSWAAAIFLTSVLEFVAEQTLQVAGQAAYTRARRESKSQRSTSPVTKAKSGPLTVDGIDVEKIALSPTLGRLWRTWRKVLRNNGGISTPTRRSSVSTTRIGRENTMSALSQRRSSFETAHEGSVADSRPISRDQKEDTGDVEHPEYVLAANIPLPMDDATRDVDEIIVPGLLADPDDEDAATEESNEPYPPELLGSLVLLPMTDDQRDIDEIEVPGLARDPDAEEEQLPKDTTPPRRHSFGATQPRESHGLPMPDVTPAAGAMVVSIPHSASQRSTSVPPPARIPVSLANDATTDTNVPAEDKPDEQAVLASGEDQAKQDETSTTEQSELKEQHPEQTEAQDHEKNHAFPWMAAGGVTAVAAAGAVTGTWATNSNHKTEETAARDWSQDSVNGAVASPESSQRDVATTEAEEPHTEAFDKEKNASQQSFTEEQIEELDRRKSLIDIKALMIVNGPSGQQSPQGEEPPSLDARAGESHTDGLDMEDVVQGVSEEEGPDDAIGVARTSDVPSTLAPGGFVEQQARDSAVQPSKLVTNEPPAVQESDSPTLRYSTSSKRGQRQFIDLTAEDGETQQNSSPVRSSYNRSTLADGAEQLAAKREAQKNYTPSYMKQGSKTPPQRASDSSGLSKTPKSPRLVSDPETMHALTSASIRGPEDFDMFVQSTDTVKYTLTPDNVRDEPVSCNEEEVKSSKANKAQVSATSQTRPEPVEMDATSTTITPAARNSRSQASKQITSADTTAATDEQDLKASRRRSIGKPPPRNVSAHRKSGLMAREPRVQTESTRDFADFIRSTGPHKDAAIAPILPTASQTSLHSLRSAHINGASASAAAASSGDHTRSFTDGTSVPPIPPMPTKPKPNMEPREAKAATTGSADLIDFIRSGPNEEGKRRISRTVAPFRTTMDSDQLQDWSDRPSVEQSQDGRLNVKHTSVQSGSVRSSTNSRAPLLSGSSNVNRTVHPAYSGASPSLSSNYAATAVSSAGATKGSEPVRKRPKNKDPYSMDFLDDDEDDDDMPISRNEESLVDFLNRNEPPSNNHPAPVIDPNSPQAQEAIRRMRTGSTGINQRQTNSSGGGRTRTMPNGSTPARSGYTSPAQSSPSFRSSSMTSSAKPIPRGGRKDIAENNNTRELADFLRNSGPEDPDSAPAPVVGRSTRSKKNSGGGFFSRSFKKKTYVDMP